MARETSSNTCKWLIAINACVSVNSREIDFINTRYEDTDRVRT